MPNIYSSLVLILSFECICYIFKEVSVSEFPCWCCVQYLSDKDFGESIVRPSSRGLNHLTLMIKISDNVYANKEIIEGEKENKDIVSLQRIGKTLKIGNETFEDLDEVRLYILTKFQFWYK